MSLYNMLNGVDSAVFLVLPMLGKHPDEYPRFRGCFLRNSKPPEIHIYTRTGGGNREYCAEENDAIRAIPGFVDDYDDDYDSTYASWIFEVPDRWKADYERIVQGRVQEISDEYLDEMCRIFPKIEDKIRSGIRGGKGVEE